MPFFGTLCMCFVFQRCCVLAPLFARPPDIYFRELPIFFHHGGIEITQLRLLFSGSGATISAASVLQAKHSFG